MIDIYQFARDADKAGQLKLPGLTQAANRRGPGYDPKFSTPEEQQTLDKVL